MLSTVCRNRNRIGAVQSSSREQPGVQQLGALWIARSIRSVRSVRSPPPALHGSCRPRPESDFCEGAGEKIGDAKRLSVHREVGSIEPGALDSDNAEDIAPLTIGDVAALAIPAQFLQQNVLRRMHVQSPSW